ncbi:MAG: GatB/YqeY domain-containing protein [Alphaproteobacteria bacterium]|nr:GatB/YqeY domain-containing protein [Alphaproteobacteria bacterium]MCD8526147.1 GatB/YqeY domain-containing protein [Alphaproteobacteria bacterium]
MDKRAEFSAAMKEAMKNKDTVGLATVRLIQAALKDRDISARGQGKTEGIDDNEILSMLGTMIKQRQESLKTYREAGREDLAEREQEEIQVIQRFMPKQLSDEELEATIKVLIKKTGAAGIKDMGKVMNALKSDYAGQADMGKAGSVVKQLLG